MRALKLSRLWPRDKQNNIYTISNIYIVVDFFQLIKLNLPSFYFFYIMIAPFNLKLKGNKIPNIIAYQ